MVRTYAPCPGEDHPNVNATTESGVDACSPVTPPSDGVVGTAYSFGPSGGCSIATKASVLKDCSTAADSSGQPLNLPARACHITKVSGKCKGIVQADATVPINEADDGWQLAVVGRASVDDGVGGDMTVVDFPMSFYFSTPKDGAMSIDATTAEALLPMFGPKLAALPACTSLEIQDMTIRDPQGRLFAVPGDATAPK